MPFLRIEARRAGPGALGILVPPGRTTLVILRPRSLPWDLLPARWDGDAKQAPHFCEFSREEAASTARRLFEHLQNSDPCSDDSLQTLGNEQNLLLCLAAGDLFWIVCRRAPGEPYRPVLLSSQEEADGIARQLQDYLQPGLVRTQEVYFNTQLFTDTTPNQAP